MSDNNQSKTCIFTNLKYDFSQHNIDQQLVKVQEELGELVKAIKKGEGDISDELGDLATTVYGLSVILGINYEHSIENVIDKVNSRLYQN